MRTARSSSRLGGLHQASPRDQAPLDHAPLPPGPGTPPHPMNRMTDRCKNITLPQTSFAGGKNGRTAAVAPEMKQNEVKNRSIRIFTKWLMVVQIKNCDRIKKNSWRAEWSSCSKYYNPRPPRPPPPAILWIATWFKNVLVFFFFLNFRMYSNRSYLVSCHHENCYMIRCIISLSKKQTQKIISQTTFPLTHISFYRAHDEKHRFGFW